MMLRRPIRAFTLLEVLVSLAIFALAAIVLAAAYVNTLTAYDTVSRRSGREQDLQLIRAALLTETDRKKIEEGGEVVLPGDRTVRWTADIESTRVADLFRVTLRCDLSDPGSRAQSVASGQVLMLLRPAWSLAGERDKLRAETRALVLKNRVR